MPTSSINEENDIIIRHETKDPQRRRQKQEYVEQSSHHSTQQNASGLSSASKEEKERRRRSADPSMQGENSASAIARQQALEERQKKENKRRSLAEPPISTSPLSSSPLRNSAGPGGFSQKTSSGAVNRGQIVQDIHSSTDNGSSGKRKSRGNFAGERNDSDIADGSLATSNSPSVLNATIHPLLSEVLNWFNLVLLLCIHSFSTKMISIINTLIFFIFSCNEDIVIGESAIMMP